ncbi:hypothetical protein DTL42_21615 [Bremerella cremea]|uniref:Heme oxygenase n=1 Tax=Bremerella cremea TaxID=1031537 RepID=A0A368KMW7_9BACT|nr:biliverdin-producing heme oxygenase [Bremerella cremea]RCS41172.1 hypothetical protein DTL42_21615 [Bremerella cremea]
MSVSDLLKTETSELHTAVEQSIDWSGWLKTIPQYEQFLIRMVSFLPEVDQRLDQLLAVPEDWFRKRRKGEWALSDLCALRDSDLHAGSEEPAIAPSADTSQFTWIADAPTAAGVLYVLEGSTMGGQQLCHLVRNSFPAEAEVPLKYLNGYGTNTRSRWQQTKAWLDQFLEATADQAKAVDAAKKMFVVYGEQLGSQK